MYFYSSSLKDARATLRCITARGYKIVMPQTLSKRIDMCNGHLVIKNPLFGTTMHEIKEINKPIKIENKLEYQNSFGFKHELKTVNSEIAKSIWEKIK